MVVLSRNQCKLFHCIFDHLLGCLKCCSVELTVTVELICTAKVHEYRTCLCNMYDHTHNKSSMLQWFECSYAIEICKRIMLDFYLRLLIACERAPMGGALYKSAKVGGQVLFQVFLYLTTKECPCHVYSDLMPLKQIIGQTVTYNGTISGFEVESWRHTTFWRAQCHCGMVAQYYRHSTDPNVQRKNLRYRNTYHGTSLPDTPQDKATAKVCTLVSPSP